MKLCPEYLRLISSSTAKCNRQPKNLRRILTKSDFKVQRNFELLNAKVHDVVPVNIQAKTKPSTSGEKKQFAINDNLSCHSKNSLYVITWSAWGDTEADRCQGIELIFI